MYCTWKNIGLNYCLFENWFPIIQLFLCLSDDSSNQFFLSYKASEWQDHIQEVSELFQDGRSTIKFHAQNDSTVLQVAWVIAILATLWFHQRGKIQTNLLKVRVSPLKVSRSIVGNQIPFLIPVMWSLDLTKVQAFCFLCIWVSFFFLFWTSFRIFTLSGPFKNFMIKVLGGPFLLWLNELFLLSASYLRKLCLEPPASKSREMSRRQHPPHPLIIFVLRHGPQVFPPFPCSYFQGFKP